MVTIKSITFFLSLLLAFLFSSNAIADEGGGATVISGPNSFNTSNCSPTSGVCTFPYGNDNLPYDGSNGPPRGGAQFRLFKASNNSIKHTGWPKEDYYEDGVLRYPKNSVIGEGYVVNCQKYGGYYFANVFDSVGGNDNQWFYSQGKPVGLSSIINFHHSSGWMSYTKETLGHDVNTPSSAQTFYVARSPLDLAGLNLEEGRFTENSIQKLRDIAKKHDYLKGGLGQIVTFKVAEKIFNEMREYAIRNPDSPNIDPRIKNMTKITDIIERQTDEYGRKYGKGIAAFCFDPGKIVAKKASFYSNSYARIEVNGHSDSGAYGHGSSKGKEFGSIQKTIIEDNKDKIQIIISHDLGVEGANVSGRKTNYKIKNTFRSSNANKDQSVILQDSYQGSYIPTKSPETKRVLDSQKVFRQPTVFSLPSKLAPGEYTVISEITFDNVDKNDAPEPKKKSSVQAKIIIKPTPTINSECPDRPPSDYYSSNINSGATYGASYVANLTSDGQWKGGISWGKTNGDVVWAKPSDSIKFMHCYYPGAQAVKKTPYRGRHGKGVYSHQARHPDRVPFIQNSYNITAFPSSSYFFGNNSSSGSTSAPSTERKIITSPSDKNNFYRCDNHPGGESFISGGYQVPGSNSTSRCHNVSSSDLGKTIQQTQAISGSKNANARVSNFPGWYADTCYRTCYRTCYKTCTKYCQKTCYKNGKPYPCSYACGSYSCFPYDCEPYDCDPYDCNWQTHPNDYYVGSHSGSVPRTTATVKIPYNYDTKTESSISNNPVVYPGESMSGDLSVKITKRDNPDVSATPYATMSFDSRVINIKFLVSPSVYDKDRIVKGGISTSDPCSYFRGKSGVTGCSEISNHFTRLNPEGNLNGKTHSYSFDQAVPDVEVGTKFCVATGVYPADSHDRPDQTLGSNANNSAGMQNNSNKWRISNASCRTISKKPNFQVFGAGAYSSGSIKTSLSHKHLHAGISTSSHNPQHLFGSWAEHYVISNGTIKGFGSGASLGYSGQGYKIPGGSNRSPSDHCQNLSPLSVANDSCPSGPGDSRINVDSPVLERLLARYLIPKTTFDSATAIPDCPSGLKCVSIANGATYAKPNSGSINSAIIRQVGSTTKNNTLIIHHEGTLNINSNITYQNGIYSNIASLPQVIIVADNINISSNVTSLDAWLIARSASGEYGKINTCSDFRESITDANSCNKRLYINGPVFAKKLSLNRTGGAGSGHASIEPAEVFDLRPDTYLWGYNQAQRYSQATVTYQKEVAPRY